MFDILFGSRFEPKFREREIIDVEYVDLSDEVIQPQTDESKLIEYGKDNTGTNL